MNSTSIIPLLLVILLYVANKGCQANISCFTCSSRNGSNVPCEDPFHPGIAENNFYEDQCKVGKEHHIGLFPGLYCVKVKGVSEETGETLIIRRCVLENMENQCGTFKFEGETLNGCVLTCQSYGCNSSNKLTIPSYWMAYYFYSVLSSAIPFFI